jgi:hypothetical protein
MSSEDIACTTSASDLEKCVNDEIANVMVTSLME